MNLSLVNGLQSDFPCIISPVQIDVAAVDGILEILREGAIKTMKVLIISLIVLGYVTLGLCLDCHQCASKDGPDCLDPYDGPSWEEDYSDGCGDRDTHCLKFKTISRLQDSGAILGEERETVVVTRGCIRDDRGKDGCKAIETDQGFMFKCLCSTDNCNGAQGVVSSLTVMIGSVMVAIATWNVL